MSKIWTTGAESPFQNGLNERIHSVTDLMLKKIEAEHPEVSLEVKLAWASTARNSLQMWHGYSSNQIVLGINPNLPNIMTAAPPALTDKNNMSSEVFKDHLNAMQSARRAFIQSEADERLRRALRCKMRASEARYSHGDQVYYFREGRDCWLGPAKVLFQDNKVVFIRHGAEMVRVSVNRIQKACPINQIVTKEDQLSGKSHSKSDVQEREKATGQKKSVNVKNKLEAIKESDAEEEGH